MEWQSQEDKPEKKNKWPTNRQTSFSLVIYYYMYNEHSHQNLYTFVYDAIRNPKKCILFLVEQQKTEENTYIFLLFLSSFHRLCRCLYISNKNNGKENRIRQIDSGSNDNKRIQGGIIAIDRQQFSPNMFRTLKI